MKYVAFVAAVLLLAGSTAHAEVRVTLHDGLVTVVAKDATVSQILTEWARVGKTTIVNVERIPGGPISVELTDLPEEQALEVLLRSVSGYMAAPRAAVAANLSRLDRVVVLPTSVAPKGPVAPAQPPTPVFGQPPRFGPPAPPEENGDDDRPAVPGLPTPNPRGPIFNTFPQPQVVNPQAGQVAMPQVIGGQAPVQQPAQPPTYPSTPTAPFGGVAVPGMMVPAPQPQPGQIVTPPVRRPDGQDGRDQL
jgi:hypothetical protein